MKTIANGHTLEYLKNFRVREIGLAVPKAEPLYLPTIANGYAPYDFVIDSSLKLYLPLWLLKGSKFKSVDRYQDTCEVTGALWRPNHRLFDGSDDKITHTLIEVADASAYSCDFWAYSTAGSAVMNSMYGSTSGSSDLRFYWSGANRRIYYYAHDTGYQFWNVGEFISQYHHFIIAFATDRTAILYKDGVATGGVKTFTSTKFRWKTMGFSSGNNVYYKGRVGEFRLYLKTLSAEEALNNFYATKFRYQ